MELHNAGEGKFWLFFLMKILTKSFLGNYAALNFFFNLQNYQAFTSGTTVIYFCAN